MSDSLSRGRDRKRVTAATDIRSIVGIVLSSARRSAYTLYAQLTAAPPNDGFDPSSRTGLGRFLQSEVERRRRDPAALAEFCLASDLRKVRPFDAKRALILLGEGEPSVNKGRAITRLLRQLPDERRFQSIRLFEGDRSARSVDALVERSVLDPSDRARCEAAVARARKRRADPRETMVLTDLDDTLLGWLDSNFKGRALPGARALVQALDEGPGRIGTAGDVHVVTARPFLGNLFLSVSRTLERLALSYGTIDYAGPFSGLLGLFGRPHKMIDEKVRRITQLIDKNPGLRIFLMGDSGQSDQEVFLRVLEARGDRVERALIREVPGFPPREAFIGHAKALVFSSYDVAAKQLWAEGYIDDKQLRRVEKDVNDARALLALTEP